MLEERTVLSATLGSALTFGNGLSSSAAFDVATDQAGNSYVTGSYTGTVDFDLSNAHAGDFDILTARGSADAFVAKYAPDDSLIWVASLGGDAIAGDQADIGRELAVDASGVVYVAGEFAGTSVFGSTTLTSLGGDDGFVAKLSATGTVEWAKRWGTSGDDGAQGVDVDASGNVYALGHRLGDSYDIMKFNAAGSMQWSKTITDRSNMTTADLAASPNGSVYVAGSFDGIVDFDPGAKTKYVSSVTSRAGFVLKLDTNGSFGWVSPFVGKQVGSAGASSFATSIALDGGGNVIVGGSYVGTVDFNPGGGTANLPTIGGAFIVKLTSTGGLTWAKALQSTSTTFVRGLDVDASGNIYASGTFTGQIDLDPGAGLVTRTTAGQSDIFAIKLTSTGNLVWAESFGGVGGDVSFGLAVSPSGGVHLAGYYRDPFDVDPNPLEIELLPSNSGSASRGLLLRLGQS